MSARMLQEVHVRQAVSRNGARAVFPPDDALPRAHPSVPRAPPTTTAIDTTTTLRRGGSFPPHPFDVSAPTAEPRPAHLPRPLFPPSPPQVEKSHPIIHKNQDSKKRRKALAAAVAPLLRAALRSRGEGGAKSRRGSGEERARGETGEGSRREKRGGT